MKKAKLFPKTSQSITAMSVRQSYRQDSDDGMMALPSSSKQRAINDVEMKAFIKQHKEHTHIAHK